MMTEPNFTDTNVAGQKASVLRRMFVGSNGIRAGWRFLIFVALLMGMQFGLQFILGKIPAFVAMGNQAQSGTITPTFGFIAEFTQTVLAFLAAFIMSRIEKRSWFSYGIPIEGAFGKLFWQGIVGGLALVSAEILLMYALGGFSFGGLALSGVAITKYAAIWGSIFLLVGISEEFLYRGYTLYTLATGIGFWPAAILLSVLFGAVHLSNSGEDWIGALSVVLFALFACFTLRRTGNLWFAIGVHAAGDFAETFIYSVPDSGMMGTGHLLNSSCHGPRWLTGGSVGPEGSALDFICTLFAFAIFAWLYPAKKTESVQVSSAR
jgi:membrane protease YdiL (CAAX protease family)